MGRSPRECGTAGLRVNRSVPPRSARTLVALAIAALRSVISKVTPTARITAPNRVPSRTVMTLTTLQSTCLVHIRTCCRHREQRRRQMPAFKATTA